jgi:hypothetical protein
VDNGALLELARNLLLFIASASQQPAPQTLPAIQVLPVAEIQRLVCEGPCTLKAFYTPERGVIVSDQLDFAKNIMAQSILLHELVHYVQKSRGAFDATGLDCGAWYDQELEAYEIQNAYLRRFGGQQLMWMDRLPKEMCEAKRKKMPAQ